MIFFLDIVEAGVPILDSIFWTDVHEEQMFLYKDVQAVQPYE
jgi:hypothetical protein